MRNLTSASSVDLRYFRSSLNQPYKGYSLWYECFQKPLKSLSRCKQKFKTMNLKVIRYIWDFLVKKKYQNKKRQEELSTLISICARTTCMYTCSIFDFSIAFEFVHIKWKLPFVATFTSIQFVLWFVILTYLMVRFHLTLSREGDILCMLVGGL